MLVGGRVGIVVLDQVVVALVAAVLALAAVGPAALAGFVRIARAVTAEWFARIAVALRTGWAWAVLWASETILPRVAAEAVATNRVTPTPLNMYDQD